MLCIDREHALFSFVREVRLQFRPHGFCALRWPREEVFITGVGRDVADNEVADIYRILPISRPKAPPAISGIRFLPKSRACFHGTSSIAILSGFGLASRSDAGSHRVYRALNELVGSGTEVFVDLSQAGMI